MSTTDIFKRWISNSPVISLDHESGIHGFIIFVFIASGMILIHSFHIHRFNYTSIRYSTDCASLVTFSASILLYLGYFVFDGTHANDIRIIIKDFVVASVLRPIVQLCDNYVIISIFILMENLTYYQQIQLNVYVWIFMIFSYVSFGIIVPFFLNLNSPIGSLSHILISAVLYFLSFFILYIRFARYVLSISSS